MELIIELPEAAFDEVYGGVHFSGHTDTGSGGLRIRQNARGGDSIAVGGDGGNASAGTGAATGGVGGVATSGVGGAGGTNTITGPL